MLKRDEKFILKGIPADRTYSRYVDPERGVSVIALMLGDESIQISSITGKELDSRSKLEYICDIFKQSGAENVGIHPTGIQYLYLEAGLEFDPTESNHLPKKNVVEAIDNYLNNNYK